MKKIIVIAAIVLLVLNWSDIADYLYPREDPAYSHTSGVTIFSTSWCSACNQAKAFLDQRGVPYLEYDVEKSTEGRRQFEALGGRGVPLILINGTAVMGFNPQKMTSLLN